MDGQGTKWRINIAENFNRTDERHRRQTGQRTNGWATSYGERELTFTFAKKLPYEEYLRSGRGYHRWTCLQMPDKYIK